MKIEDRRNLAAPSSSRPEPGLAQHSFLYTLRALAACSVLAVPTQTPKSEILGTDFVSKDQSAIVDRTLSDILDIPGWLNTDRLLTAEALRGRVVMVYFWGTFCPPCLQAIPQLNQLQADNEKEGFILLALSPESAERVSAFQRKKDREKTFQTIVGVEASEVVAKFGVGGYPTAVLFDRDGTMIMEPTVLTDKTKLLKSIDKALHDNAASAQTPSPLILGQAYGTALTAIRTETTRPATSLQYSLPTLLSKIESDEFNALSAHDRLAILCSFYNANLPQAVWKGDAEARVESQNAMFALVANTSEPERREIAAAIYKLMLAGDPDPVVREGLATSFRLLRPYAIPRGEWSKYVEPIRALAQKENDPSARATFEELAHLLGETWAVTESAPSRLDQLRKTQTGIFDGHQQEQRAIRIQLADEGLSWRTLEKINQLGFEVERNSKTLSDEALIRRACALEVASDAIFAEKNDPAARVALAETLTQLFLADESQNDMFYQYLLLLRIGSMEPAKLSVALQAKLLPALEAAQKSRDLFKVARIVELKLYHQGLPEHAALNEERMATKGDSSGSKK